MDGAPVLLMRGVCHGYPLRLGLSRQEVLQGIDLTLAPGGTLGLAGPNGSGKSTLLRLIAGLERQGAGELQVLGGSPLQARVRRRLGYLPEDSPFPLELTLRGALLLLGSLQGLKGRELRARAERLLSQVGLTQRARTTLARCSRGMLRRFGLAQAWLHAPELLLLDEPTAGLDAQGFEVLEELLDEARVRGASVVLSSHLASDLTRRCERLAVLWEGRLARCGPPGELLDEGGLLPLYRALARERAP